MVKRPTDEEIQALCNEKGVYGGPLTIIGRPWMGNPVAKALSHPINKPKVIPNKKKLIKEKGQKPCQND